VGAYSGPEKNKEKEYRPIGIKENE